MTLNQATVRPSTSDIAVSPAVPTSVSTSEAWSLVRECVVGRLAVVLHGQPEVFPINHVVDHGTVVFRTAKGSKLSACAGHLVAFEVDGYDLARAVAWSVVIKGVAREIRARDDVLAALQLPIFPWHDSVKPHFVRIEPDSITARRFPVLGGTTTEAGRS